MKITIYGVALALVVGLANGTARAQTDIKPNSDPVGRCVLDLARKVAPSAETAVSLAEYIADRCMELDSSPDCGVEPPEDAPGAAWGQWDVCNRIHENAMAEKREITREFAYKFIVLFRQEGAHH